MRSRRRSKRLPERTEGWPVPVKANAERELRPSAVAVPNATVPVTNRRRSMLIGRFRSITNAAPRLARNWRFQCILLSNGQPSHTGRSTGPQSLLGAGDRRSPFLSGSRAAAPLLELLNLGAGIDLIPNCRRTFRKHGNGCVQGAAQSFLRRPWREILAFICVVCRTMSRSLTGRSCAKSWRASSAASACRL